MAYRIKIRCRKVTQIYHQLETQRGITNKVINYKFDIINIVWRSISKCNFTIH